MKSEDYVVVTTISSHQVRYVMYLTAEECEEFSQEHKGECIINAIEMDEHDVLDLFDKENAYLSGWTKDQKIEWIRKTIDK